MWHQPVKKIVQNARGFSFGLKIVATDCSMFCDMRGINNCVRQTSYQKRTRFSKVG
jgi:hypothetical protein